MNVPNLPHPLTQLVMKDGTMHPDWYNFYSQLTKEMQTNLSEEGLNIPQQTTNNISTLQTNNPLPSFLYDSDLDVLKVSIKGTYKTVQTV